ncbi:hypothetical protein COO91_09366 (plasmid) [Nostoc flagelliforme CCNUN1]|uniref:Uncharacterized protein n=1 Tax=Nostoc flagelliforme CCNUN1 TaxID=2038116 RepID=A0A2K8T7Y5_9NOSO|nr:hypothetical protein COO91_09366 [Nostoc flagelliforme CCNUN1]
MSEVLTPFRSEVAHLGNGSCLIVQSVLLYFTINLAQQVNA